MSGAGERQEAGGERPEARAAAAVRREWSASRQGLVLTLGDVVVRMTAESGEVTLLHRGGEAQVVGADKLAAALEAFFWREF